MTTMVQDIQPLFNRVVIFNTGADTYHGHPHSLNTPNGMSRISLALYYYTKENPDAGENSVTSAVWKEIPIKVKKEGPTMCFATMCKNEEHCIKDTLESVYRYIDYWVVCDTGSTDRTKDIVREFFAEKGIPGELVEHEWIGFDHNKSLMMGAAYGKSDYVIHLDADDWLMGDFFFTEEDAGSDLYFMKVKRGSSEWKAYIIFNNRLRWKFCGVAHTILNCLDKDQTIVADISDREAYVSGEERGSRMFDPKKYFIDAEKLKRQFFDTLLDDPYNLNRRSAFYTAQSYMDCGMFHESIKWNRLYLNLQNTWDEERFEAQMRVSLCMINLKYSTQIIIDEMEKSMEIFPDRVEPIYHLGKYLVGAGEHEKAYNYLLKGTKLDFSAVKDKYILFLNENCYGKNLYDDLSVACYWTERYQEGLNYLNQILDLPSFANESERLLLNVQHFKNRMES
jgi:glycosyltransferase involved in cell wall biosynthesis